MKRKIAYPIILWLCLAWPSASTAQQALTPNQQELEARIARLEHQREDLQHSLANYKDELRLTAEHENDGLINKLFGIGGVVLAVVAFLGIGIWTGVGKVEGKVLTKLQSTVEEKVDARITPEIDNSINRFVREKLPQEINAFIEMSQRQKREAALKANLRIVLLAENHERGARAAADMAEAGFSAPEIVIWETEQLPEADLIVFGRDGAEPVNVGWKQMADNKIKRAIQSAKDRPGVILLYYGPRNDHLDPAMHPRLGFANMPSTLGPRIMELLTKSTT